MANIPPQNGFPVTTRTYSWGDEVRRQWGAEWSRPDIGYEMSNGRKFDSTDAYATGIYRRTKKILDSILLASHYPDAPAHLLLSQGGKLLMEQ